ncbi:hypothetical protein OHT68_18030 [Streptomyces canus]|uniref:hypothetical protein n=1 Tax=Streptomyces canus TaxID=58343 RepID=UPI002E2D9E85|nr:hypothetical protein [Streptomyces canus]
MNEIDPQELADRYTAQWNVSDAAERRAAIERLWAEDGAHILHPPAEMRETAAGLGFDHPTLEARGHGVVRIGWEAVSAETGDVVGGGSDMLVLDDDGRIKTDYMFPGS